MRLIRKGVNELQSVSTVGDCSVETVSETVSEKQPITSIEGCWVKIHRAQELCERSGGRVDLDSRP